MSHELETILVEGQQVASFAFTGKRENIWHRLGTQLGGKLMTAREAMGAAHLDRAVRIERAAAPEGTQWAVDERGESTAPYHVILEGKVFVTDEGQLGEIPSKVVGVAGNQAAIAHDQFTVEQKFEVAEEITHASHGTAVWSTAGALRDGRQGFACMEAPPIIVDPNGLADVIQQYVTLQWSYDGSIPCFLLGASNIRVVCANTQRAHDRNAVRMIRVKATSGAEDRARLAAQTWALAQDEAKALALQGERMLAKANGKRILKGLCENVLGLTVTADMPKRQRTIREHKLGEVKALYAASTNMPALGDNGYAAFQTIVEYLDWFSPVKADADDQDACTTLRLANQFDGTHTGLKAQAAAFVLASA